MDGETGRDEELRLAKRGALLEVNIHIREAAQRLDAAGPGAAWEFMCECGTSDCHTLVRLTLAQYEALKTAEEPIIAAGHGLSRSARARRVARERREDAEGLRQQAKLQLERARRNLGSAG